MDSEEDTALLGSHDALLSYVNKRTAGCEEEGVVEYLKNIKYPPIPDFPKGLDWYNVAEELSFTKQLRGKLVLLDFFTYCCINCMHILPDLKDIENDFSIEDGLVVIGVHSAKFENEKDKSNVLAAIQRYNISHPVVNDDKCFMWQSCHVQCWPTLLLLGPNAEPIVMLTGEGHKQNLQVYIRAALSFYNLKSEILHHKITLQPAYHFLPSLKGPLTFPGKITCYDSGTEVIAISDTGNHRILIFSDTGILLQKIGVGRSGFKDGTLEDALFNSPQGIAFKNKDTLFVADTENHAIRKIDLNEGTVTTIAGIGEQGEDYKGGKDGKIQEISSPWDIALYRTSELKEILFIAMAGTHQIWALFLDGMIWWKNQQYLPGTCICVAGSGREENRNNQYPHAAAFAQPSGLVVCHKNKEIYIADSESSSIRRLSLVDGKVTAVVGGDRNPNNLFAYGDKDGKLYEAKLQHILGLSISKDDNYLFIADTYNHKIKKVDITNNYVTTLDINKKLNEPGGLCVSADGKKLYIADTNNHCIKVLPLNDSTLMHIEPFCLKLESVSLKSYLDKSKVKIILTQNPICINSDGGKIIIAIHLKLDDGLKLTLDVPQQFVVDVPNAAWSCTPSNYTSNVFETDVVLNVPSGEENKNLDCVYKLVACTKDRCVPKTFVIRQILSFKKNAPISHDLLLTVWVGENSIKVEKRS